MNKNFCVSLIGMPGSGKSTIGSLLAKLLDYAFIDTDYLLEALYARRLQDLTEAMSRDELLDAEARVVAILRGKESVIATGGSVIYRPCAMQHLRELGPVVYLRASQATVAKRISLNPERGIFFGPGQSLDDLYGERIPLYVQYCDLECNTEIQAASACANFIAGRIAHWQGRDIA